MPKDTINAIRFKHPTVHSMHRRNDGNDYTRGNSWYMWTLTTEEDSPLFGHIIGDVNASEGTPSFPHTELTPLGEEIERCWKAIPLYHPEIELDEYVIMPEHMHGIVHVKRDMSVHISEVEKGFRTGCNKAYRRLLIEGRTRPTGMARQWLREYNALSPEDQAYVRQHYCAPTSQNGGLQSTTPQSGTPQSGTAAAHKAACALPVSGGTAARLMPASAPAAPARRPFPIDTSRYNSHQEVGFLFRTGYNDKTIFAEDKLEARRHYVRMNAHGRLLRSQRRDILRVQRGAIDTGLTVAALDSYLRANISYLNEEHLAAVKASLLIVDDTIRCDAYGDAGILAGTLLPVVCHRRDRWRYERQREYMLTASKQGSVLISAAIAEGERKIFREAMDSGGSLILIKDAGFPTKYHPSEAMLAVCGSSRLLILSPWKYEYGTQLSQEASKTMNAIAQALAHKKDNIWY